MNSRRMAITGVAAAALLVLPPAIALADNPNSGTIPSTDQSLNIEITAPADGTTVPAGQDLAVTGITGVGNVGGSASIAYVVDLSGSTENPSIGSDLDCNGDGASDGGDDANGDGDAGFVVDCEIEGIVALNESLAEAQNLQAGLVAFGSSAAAADVGPADGDQALTTPVSDDDDDGTRDIEQVARSLQSSFGGSGTIGQFSPQSVGVGTNFTAALEATGDLLGDAPGATKVAYFLSDGTSSTLSDAAVEAMVEAGIVVNTFAISSGSTCGAPTGPTLARISADTGGTCTDVEDPTQLSTALTGVNPSGIDRVEVSLDGGAPAVADLDASGNFSATIDGASLTPGQHTIEATVFADDEAQTSVTADVTVTAAAPCTEDGLNQLVDGTGIASGVIHDPVEGLVDDVDSGLGLDAGLGSTVHDLNCDTVVPLEDAIDELVATFGGFGL